jgi:diamine N-acetyltransferase
MHSIQKATTEHIPLIRELTYQVWPQTYASILSQDQIDYMLEMMYSPSSLTKQINEGAQFIIVYEEKSPVGFASYQLIGKGTGRFIIDYIIEEIKMKNAVAMQLQVNKQNKAKEFYEKLGFTVIKEFAFDIGNGYVMDDYIMEKKLG